MTIEEKRKALDEFCFNHLCDQCPLHVPELKCGRGEHFCVNEGRMSDKDVELAYSIAFHKSKGKCSQKNQECGIKDSGTRRQFDTGAVRDIQEGKGRCDLLPLDVIASIIPIQTNHHRVIGYINGFVTTSDTFNLVNALEWFRNVRGWDIPTMILEVAKHFEEGCKKYGERNWQKGIPTHCYIDSAVRHYLKWLRSDKDEPHDRAFCWNILCCIWTCVNKPELNDYPVKEKASGEGLKPEKAPSNENRCVICFETIPEGRQLCPKCEKKGWKKL